MPSIFFQASVLKNILYSSRNISDDFFSQSPKFFPIRFLKLLTTFLVIYQNLFASVFKFHENSLLGCPPVLHHAPVTTFFSSFLVTYLHSFTKTGPLDAPRVDARGRRTVRTPISARHCTYTYSERESLLNVCVRLLKTSRCVHERFALLIGA